MSLRIIKPGVLDTIQDLGRWGYQHLGINPGGVMDRFTARMVNSLAGNEHHEAVIEMHFPAPVILFEKETLLVIGGADFAPTINGEAIPILHPILVSKNSILQFTRRSKGARCYLAVHGGFQLNSWLNSYSTNLKAGMGGIDGRPFQKDTLIHFRKSIPYHDSLRKTGFTILPWQADDQLHNSPPNKIHILTGSEWNLLTEQSKEHLVNEIFTITPASDRMGYRMRGKPLETSTQKDQISSAVSFGTIQLLSSGQLIILMAEHQTAGGYPKIGHVISAHLPILAQLNPSDSIEFKITNHAYAEELLLNQEQHLLQLENACKFRLQEMLI